MDLEPEALKVESAEPPTEGVDTLPDPNDLDPLGDEWRTVIDGYFLDPWGTFLDRIEKS